MSTKRNMVVLFLMLALIVTAFAIPLRAQGGEDKPQVNVAPQVSMNGMVRVDSAYSEGPGFIVIHIDNKGKPGGVAGFRWLSPGWNYNIDVQVGEKGFADLTPVLHAMLHVDDGKIGVYEFDGKTGLDNPVRDSDNNIITSKFVVNAFFAHDQLIKNNSLVIDWMIVPQDSWIVIHKDDNGKPGGVLGQTAVRAGHPKNITVKMSEDRTEVLWPMIHVNDGNKNQYEFDGKSGLDNPVVINGVLASAPIWMVPHIRAYPQIVTPGDGGTVAEKPSMVVDSVLSQGPGVMVIHKDDNGKPGGVAGFALVKAGYNPDVKVDLDPKEITPVLWPMLHVNDGDLKKYEFDGKSGLDNPITDSAGNVITIPVNAAPSIWYDGKIVEGDHVWVAGALIDKAGWLAIHSDNGKGEPGPVIGVTPLLVGMNLDILVHIEDTKGMTEKLFPMLHYDTGKAGEYEFDGKNGLDLPTFVAGNVVVGLLNIAK